MLKQPLICYTINVSCDQFHNFFRFVEDYKQREKDDIFKHRKPADLKKFPRVQSSEDLPTHYKCLPLNLFQLKDQSKLPDKLDRSKMIRIWQNMRTNIPVSK